MKMQLKILVLLGALGLFAPHAFGQFPNCPGGAAANCGLGWTTATSISIQAPQNGSATAFLQFTQTQGANPFYYNFQISTAFPNDFTLQQGTNGPAPCNYGTGDPSPCDLSLLYQPSTLGNESATITLFASGAGSNLSITVNAVTISPPTITSFTPGSGPSGTSVTVTGTGFTGASIVTFNGTAASSFTISSDTQIIVLVPSGATTGPIAVSNIAGTGASSSNFIVTAQDVTGKWVLYQTAPISPVGNRCFDSQSEKCYYLMFDVDSNLTSPANSFQPGTVLAFDNTTCDSGTILSLSMSYSNGQFVPAGWDIQIIDGATWSVFFSGGDLFGGTYSGFNFDGSPTPFSGTVSQLAGTDLSTGGCVGPGGGIGFKAIRFPSLQTAVLSLNTISQPGTLDLPLQISLPISENADFSISGNGPGSLAGPACGSLALSITDGISIGPISEVDGTYSNPAGGTGTWSLGWQIISPFLVSSAELQANGYSATGPGYALAIWSVDFSASSDGSCQADPQVGTGVAYPQHGEHREFHPQPRKRDKADHKFFEKFKARASEQ